METHNLKIAVPDGYGINVNGVFVPCSGETIMTCTGNDPRCVVCTSSPKTRECYEQHTGPCWHS